MARLSNVLVQREIASLRDVEEALARQVLYGGDVISNFLEQTSAPVDESALTGVMAEVLGLDAPYVGELPRADDALRRLVPRDVALRYNLFPLGVTQDTLRIAVSDRLAKQALEDLGFSLGKRVVQCAALHVRIREALARDYGAPLDRRASRGLARLAGLQDPSPSKHPSPLEGAPPLASLPRSPTIPPFGAPGKRLFSNESHTPSVHEAITAPAPPVVEESTLGSKAPPKPTAGASGTHAAVILHTEEPAPPTHPAPHVAVDLAASVVPQSQSGVATVRRPPAATPTAKAEKESEYRAARARARHRGPYTAAEAEQDLLAAEERDDVLGVFVDFAAQYFDYVALFAVVGDIAEGRDAHGPGATANEVSGVGVPLEIPSVLSRARDKLAWELAALADTGLDAQLARDLLRPVGNKAMVIPVAVRGRCVLLLYGDDGQGDVQLTEVGDVIAFAPLVANALESVIRRKKAAARAAAGAPADATRVLADHAKHRQSHSLPSRDERASALASALDPKRSRAPKGPDPSASSSLGPPPPKPPSGAPGAAAPAVHEAPPPPKPSSPRGAADAARVQASARSLGPAPPKPGAQHEDDDEDPAGASSTGDALSGEAKPVPSRKVAVAATPPPSRRMDSALGVPTVVVDSDGEAARLVDELIAGNRSAASTLANLGGAGLGALMANFPGPTGGKPPTTPAPQAGPILEALVHIGVPAVPFLLTRTNDEDAERRAWAINTLGFIRTKSSAVAVARRTADQSERVRSVAREAGRRLLEDEECRATLLEATSDMAARPATTAHSQTLALEALAAWRAPETVPHLIPLLGQSPDISASARWALEVITRQSFGTDEAAWREWWEQNRDRHRIEWLIDALTNPDQEIRRLAGEELKNVTREYLGYYEDLPEDERALVQRRYARWWQQEGRARFAHTLVRR